ncbi:MAG: rhodanese-like domain-containing protein [Burkholderiales bacterium]|nr:rhodanese-like domain-containing protein [Burkholderiales bacterium]
MLKKLLVALACLGVGMTVCASTVVVDVRTPQEIAETGKVEGALNCDFQAKDFMNQIRANHIGKDDKVQVYCKAGKRAVAAKEALEKEGYKNVEVLGGYEDAAKKLGKPLVKP